MLDLSITILINFEVQIIISFIDTRFHIQLLNYLAINYLQILDRLLGVSYVIYQNLFPIESTQIEKSRMSTHIYYNYITLNSFHKFSLRVSDYNFVRMHPA